MPQYDGTPTWLGPQGSDVTGLIDHGQDRRLGWLSSAFLKFDLLTKPFVNQGCTANAAYIDHAKKMLYIANLGDARCIIGKKNR